MGAAPLPVDDTAITMTRMLASGPIAAHDDGSSCSLSTTTTARGKSSWPPGFRFHPTDEELVLYYLKRKIRKHRFKLAMIADLDVYKLEPWELPDRSLLRTGDKQWYFFSPRDKKYPNGSRSNRTTRHGYWKATGKDRTINHNSRVVGNKKTLVYYHGRAPKGARTDWVMHEYTMDEQEVRIYNNVQNCYALYKVFRKSGPGPKNGEDYGAPFREEEWDDDDDDGECKKNSQRDQNGTMEQSLNSGAEPARPNLGRNTLPLSELEDFLIGFANDQDMVQQPTEASERVSEVDCDQDVTRSLHFTPEGTCGKQQENWYELCHIEDVLQVEELFASEIAPVDVSETISFNCIDHGQPMEGEDFLQIEDFINPETEVQSSGDAYCMNQVQDGSNALNDFDDYFDASMFLAESMGPVDVSVPNSYSGDLAEDETQIHSWHATADLWIQDLALHESSSVVPSQRVDSLTPDVAIDNTTQVQQPQEQLILEDDGSESWFSSALSALLNSVPSRPALASENALITRALVRVSSFGAGQRGRNDVVANSSTPIRRGPNGRGFLFVSFLVGLGAIMWVLTIGAAVKVFRGLWSRFVSS